MPSLISTPEYKALAQAFKDWTAHRNDCNTCRLMTHPAWAVKCPSGKKLWFQWISCNSHVPWAAYGMAFGHTVTGYGLHTVT